MKYKVLVTGNNASVIDSFFHQMENNFEALTTSIRYADIIRHMNCYEPDAFVYCLHNEPRDHIMQMASVKYKLAQEDIPFILLGSKEECDEFEKMAVNVADLILYRPLSAEAIQERILKFFKGKKPRKESGAQNDAAKENTGLGGGRLRQEMHPKQGMRPQGSQECPLWPEGLPLGKMPCGNHRIRSGNIFL